MENSIKELENIQKELEKFKESIVEYGFDGDPTTEIEPLLKKLEDTINNIKIDTHENK